MITKINSITNFAVFQNFDWDKEVLHKNGQVQSFQDINIIYGRNYSGKTTLSRIFRAMETSELSDKIENPDFSVAFTNNSLITQKNLSNHGKIIRVFNEDFVRTNLRFINNPDEDIEPFAILGDDNIKIEKAIKELETKLGSNEEGKETGMYAQLKAAITRYSEENKAYSAANENLEKQLRDKATDRKIGIKYNSERFGNQNYDIRDLKIDIKKVQEEEYQRPTEEQFEQYKNLIQNTALAPISPFDAPELKLESLAIEAEPLIIKQISKSNKIEELVKNAILNRWVHEGRKQHKNTRDICAFCNNPISESRWQELDKHFDEESAHLEKNIDALLNKLETEQSTVSKALTIDKSLFYSKFHAKLDELDKILKEAVAQYNKSLESLTTQLKNRKEDILNHKIFDKPDIVSVALQSAWKSYEAVRIESDNFTASLESEQKEAKSALRLAEVSNHLTAIKYQDQLDSIEILKEQTDKAQSDKEKIEEEIFKIQKLISSKKHELIDEEKGASKINEYLNNFFGHKFLTLKPRKDNQFSEPQRIHFEVMRGNKKAYHLSEGECSLLAFCYFLAKLNDIDTQNTQPIIWIDDPISSLDGNHIFFVYTLLNTEIVATGRFKQLFVSTHNLEFLKYLKKLQGKFVDLDGQEKQYQKSYFMIVRKDKSSTIEVMPKYLKNYVTEFNYLFHQIYMCANIESINDDNYVVFYNFANNARKFLEIYLYYKYPCGEEKINEKMLLFFGEDKLPCILTDRLNNEYSHLCGMFERGTTPVEEPEMKTVARKIIERLKTDKEQFSALLKSIGEDQLAGGKP